MILVKLFTGVATFVRNKARLVIEYVMIAAVVALGGACFGLWLKNNATEVSLATASTKIERLQGRVGSLEFENSVQDQTISELERRRQQGDEAFKTLADHMKTLAEKDRALRLTLARLERENETVRNFMDTPVPDGVRMELETTSTRGSGSAEAVLPSPANVSN